MARGSKVNQDAAHSGMNFSTGLQGTAGNIYSTLAPGLTAQATHPTGFSPADLAAMNTASQQSAGGATAAAKGEGGLLAARTRNAGAPAAAMAKSIRSASEGAGERAVGIQAQNAQEKLKQQQAAQSGLERLYGTDVTGSNQALGEVANNMEADARNKAQSFWGQLGSGLTSAIGTRLGGGQGGKYGLGFGG